MTDDKLPERSRDELLKMLWKHICDPRTSHLPISAQYAKMLIKLEGWDKMSGKTELEVEVYIGGVRQDDDPAPWLKK